MLEEVENLLKSIKTVRKAEMDLDQYRAKFDNGRSWYDIVRAELMNYSFSEIDKIELRHAIEALEQIEGFINDGY